LTIWSRSVAGIVRTGYAPPFAEPPSFRCSARAAPALIRRIGGRINVIDEIIGNSAVTRAVIVFVGRNVLIADGINPDVVAVAHDIVGDAKVFDIAVQHESFGRAESQAVQLIPVNHNLAQGFRCAGAIHGNAVRVPALDRLHARLDVMHAVVEQLNLLAVDA
jgi:hypothetical protein